MRKIEGVLLEPVGCLAEFPSEPFHEIAVRFFGRKGKASKSGSRSYWHLLNLMGETLPPHLMEPLEIGAVNAATIYEDVLPALVELKAMGIHLAIASSLSGAAVTRFLEPFAGCFSAVWHRGNSGGIKTAPITAALRNSFLRPEQTIYLTDTVEGLRVARNVGVGPILMMNDPDEARRLALHNPAGGIVSLHELPDFVRLLAAQQS